LLPYLTGMTADAVYLELLHRARKRTLLESCTTLLEAGWTGLAAKLIQMVHILDPQTTLKGDSRPVMHVYHR
jgi:hypothetical protein